MNTKNTQATGPKSPPFAGAPNDWNEQQQLPVALATHVPFAGAGDPNQGEGRLQYLMDVAKDLESYEPSPEPFVNEVEFSNFASRADFLGAITAFLGPGEISYDTYASNCMLGIILAFKSAKPGKAMELYDYGSVHCQKHEKLLSVFPEFDKLVSEEQWFAMAVTGGKHLLMHKQSTQDRSKAKLFVQLEQIHNLCGLLAHRYKESNGEFPGITWLKTEVPKLFYVRVQNIHQLKRTNWARRELPREIPAVINQFSFIEASWGNVNTINRNRNTINRNRNTINRNTINRNRNTNSNNTNNNSNGNGVNTSTNIDNSETDTNVNCNNNNVPDTIDQQQNRADDPNVAHDENVQALRVLENKNISLQKDLDDERNRTKKYQMKRKKIRGQKVKLQKQYAQLEDELFDVQCENAETKKKYAQLEEDFFDTEDELAETEKELDETKKELDETKKKLDELQAKHFVLKSEYRDAFEDSLAAHATAVDAKGELERVMRQER